MTPCEKKLLACLDVSPRTVSQLHDQLARIDEWGRQERDLRGTFAAAYVVVTQAIGDALLADEFGDPNWVIDVVVDFGRRYLTALRDYVVGGEIVYAWRFALALRRGNDVEAIGALLLSMIAHIHYDLAHSLWSSGPFLPQRKIDYVQVGDVIANATHDIQRVVLVGYASQLEPLHRRLDGFDLQFTRVVVRMWRRRALSVAYEMTRHPFKAMWWSRRLNVESAMLALLCNGLTQILRNVTLDDDEADSSTSLNLPELPPLSTAVV